MLLEREGVNPNTADGEYGQTPLLWAAQRGYEGIVKLLLERADLNPDIPGPSGETALDSAVSREHSGIVRLLSQPWLSLLIPIDIGKAANVGQSTLPQGNLLNNSKKRTIHLSDGGEERKKHRGAPT